MRHETPADLPERRRGDVTFRTFLILAALSMLAVHVYSAFAYAQAPPQQLRELERDLIGVQQQIAHNRAELASIQARLAAQEALLIERRLTRLETTSEVNQRLLIGIVVAVALQLLETLYRIMAGRRNGRA